MYTQEQALVRVALLGNIYQQIQLTVGLSSVIRQAFSLRFKRGRENFPTRRFCEDGTAKGFLRAQWP